MASKIHRRGYLSFHIKLCKCIGLWNYFTKPYARLLYRLYSVLILLPIFIHIVCASVHLLTYFKDVDVLTISILSSLISIIIKSSVFVYKRDEITTILQQLNTMTGTTDDEQRLQNKCERFTQLLPVGLYLLGTSGVLLHVLALIIRLNIYDIKELICSAWYPFDQSIYFYTALSLQMAMCICSMLFLSVIDTILPALLMHMDVQLQFLSLSLRSMKSKLEKKSSRNVGDRVIVDEIEGDCNVMGLSRRKLINNVLRFGKFESLKVVVDVHLTEDNVEEQHLADVTLHEELISEDVEERVCVVMNTELKQSLLRLDENSMENNVKKDTSKEGQMRGKHTDNYVCLDVGLLESQTKSLNHQLVKTIKSGETRPIQSQVRYLKPLEEINKHQEHQLLQQFETNLEEIINKHHAVLSLVKDINSAFNTIIFVQFLSNYVSLCFIIYQITIMYGLDDRNVMAILCAVMYFMVSLMQIWLLCYFGTKVISQGEDVAAAAYETPWYELSSNFKSSLRLVMQRAQRPALLTGHGFYKMTNETFIAICSASISYFSVLREVIGLHEK